MALTPEEQKLLKDLLKDQSGLYEKIVEQQEKLNQSTQERLNKLKAEIETLKVLAKETGNYAELTRAQDEANVKSAELQFKADVERLSNLRKLEATQGEINEVQKRVVNSAKNFNDEINKAKDNARALEKGNALAKLLGIDEANQNSLTYQIFTNPSKVFQGFNEKIQNSGGLVKSLSMSILTKVQEATTTAFFAADQAYSSFAAATGATAAYNDIITQTARGNTALGIGFKESSKAVTDLYTNLNTFSKLNQSTQAQLTVTTAKLEKLGISGTDTAKSIASLSVMMGTSEEQAAKVVERFAAMGQAIGVSSKQMISDFMAVKDQLAVFGSAMDSTFIKLEAQSKATGVAVNDLLTLTNKFDTFEGAASQVAKLNAILGGPFLSAMSMIETTDPTERINNLRQAVNNAGISFDQMSYYEKKAIMEAGGFKSVEEAQRILSMSAGEAAEELQNQQASQKALNDAIERAQPIQEKLSMIMANFAVVMEKPVTYLSALLSGVLRIMDELPFLGTLLGGIITTFTALKIISGIKAMFLALTGVFSLFAPAAAPVAPAVTPIGGAISRTAAILAAATPVIIKASAGLGIFALALLVVGAAVYMVGLGFKAMFEGFAAVLEQGVKAPDIFLNMAVGILALTAAIYALSLNPLAFIGIANLVAAIYGISRAINSVETEKVIGFKTIMEKSVEISEPSTIQGFEKFSEKFQAVVKATATIDATKTQNFANLLVATQNLSQAFKVNTTVNVKIGDKKFEAFVEEVINRGLGDASTNGSS